MFDLTSSKLLILAVVALIVVGPKDLPALLRTIGKYVGMIRRQANEFRSQFEEAMRDSELADLKKEVETLGQETSDTLRKATDSIESDMSALNSDIDSKLSDQTRIDTNDWMDAHNEAIMSSEPGAVEAVADQVKPTPPVPATPPIRSELPKATADAGADTSRGGA
jgi:sec-independent protein translocase protein TatB